MRFILLSTVLFFALSACKKEESSSSLTGTWELRQVNGLQVKGASPDIPAGQGNIVKISDNYFEKYYGDKLVQKSTYKVEKVNLSVNNDVAEYKITFDDDSYMPSYLLNVEKKKLTIYIGAIASDGVEEIYLRK
ncbi:hypothetical protein GS399_17865 [Pedobacter sp. HMF7647]|uniref:Lipocalin-like domain-containing protein n=1 Tax=Hufsiella arboris TaxID=2695275 RepID=A0A7K1YE14_9SPHI|nr:hypothetical protein [Hufsiella arboris]MXV52843.1 hypothetical protein [Hufsiella arboris]